MMAEALRAARGKYSGSRTENRMHHGSTLMWINDRVEIQMLLRVTNSEARNRQDDSASLGANSMGGSIANGGQGPPIGIVSKAGMVADVTRGHSMRLA